MHLILIGKFRGSGLGKTEIPDTSDTIGKNTAAHVHDSAPPGSPAYPRFFYFLPMEIRNQLYLQRL